LTSASKVRTTATVELGAGIGEILHGLAQGGDDQGVVNRLVGVHGGALDGGVGGAQAEGGGAVAGLHGRNNVGAESLVEGGHGEKETK
jgi:hypothetical protein